MGNGNVNGLSINAKTIILVLLFVNVGFAVKMLNKYYKMKEAGYVREQTFSEQLEKRVMKAFGSMEELNAMVTDLTEQRERAEVLAESYRKQSEELRNARKKLEEEKIKLEEERARLQRRIWELEDSLSLAKKTMRNKDLRIQGLMDEYEKLKKENEELKEKLEGQKKSPEEWSIPPQ